MPKLNGQVGVVREFLKSKGKDQAAMVFLVLKSLRPLWSMLL